MATVAKTFKLDQATIEKLQGVIDATGLTWDGAFAMLASQYTAQQAAQATGRETEMQDFAMLLSKISEAYSTALAINANTDERIRAEYSHRLTASEEAVASLKEKLSAANDKANVAADELKVAKAEAESMAAKADEAAEQAAKANDALNDKETLITMLKAESANLKQQIEQLSKQAKLGDEAEAQRKRAEAAEDEVQKLKEQLAEANGKNNEIKGRYDEKLEIAAAKAENEKNAAVLAAKAEAAKEMDALRARLAEISNSFLSQVQVEDEQVEDEKPHTTRNRKKADTAAE